MMNTFAEFFEDFKRKLIEKGHANPKWFKGCTEEEIEALIKAQGIKRLPAAFRQYLSVMGNGGPDNLFFGSDWEAKWMAEFRETLLESIELDPSFDYPNDAFVFFVHHGYSYLYFLTDNDDDNPPVYLYKEGDGVAKPWAPSITAFFDNLLKPPSIRK